MQLTNSQLKTVNKIFDAFKKRSKNKSCSFVAPTGAGKTLMASEFISRVFFDQSSSKKTIFVIATISSAKLPKQFAKKLKKYQKFHVFQNYKIEHIESPSNTNTSLEDIPEFVLENNKVFVFGVSSFRKKTLFTQEKTLDVFLQQAKELNYQIFFIRDEAHIGEKEKISKKELQTFDEKLNKASSFVIKMTATPKDKTNLIQMTTNDMLQDGVYLLKTKLKKPKLGIEITNEEIIDDAIQEFKKSKKEYQTIKEEIINPAMLIQVMNEPNVKINWEKNRQFHNQLSILRKKLKNSGLKCLEYLKNPKTINTNAPKTLDYASQLDSEYDVIIFKVGPATGWDIPRANMLLQLRHIFSENLNIQTLGRIKRNPYPKLKHNLITNKYYVYSNYQEPSRNQAYYKIKDKFLNENFISGKIDITNRKIIENDNKYENEVIKFIQSNKFQNKVKDQTFNNITYDPIDYIVEKGKAKIIDKIDNYYFLKIYNINKHQQYENELKLSSFYGELNKISTKKRKNIEVIKYIFYSFISKWKSIKNNNLEWLHDSKPYLIEENKKLLKNYSLWKDNKNPKCVDTSYFENYGYIQITLNKNEEAKQYLDSKPEIKFYNKFKEFIFSKDQLKKINFFAKTPSLGSQVFFEYYSKAQGKITRSYIDFAIKYNKKLIMVEVKSKDTDYDPKKTNDLLLAYKNYMKNFDQLSLVLYQYDGIDDSHYLHGWIDNDWKEGISFNELFSKLLN